MHIDAESLAALPHRYRTQLVNSIAGIKSANLVGTRDRAGATNLAIVNSVFHLGAHPPLLGTVFRPDSVPRHSLENLLATGVYTLNHVTGEMVPSAHQTAARYPREQSEFDATGLTPLWQGDFEAPFVKESRVRLGMRYREHHPMAINGTIIVIGEICHIHMPEHILGEDGFADLEQAGSVAVIGLDSYHSTRRLDRLSYAKPGTEPRSLDGA